MRRLNEEITQEREMELLTKLYNYISHSLESVDNDIEHDYITCNVGRDGKDYFWYLDEFTSVAIRVEDGEIVDDEVELEKLFY